MYFQRLHCSSAATLLVHGWLLASAFGQPSALKVIETKCLVCHGGTRMSDLDLRERATMLQGGKRGPAIVPGKAESSLIYQAVKREGPLQMPPGKTPLTPEEIAVIKSWIDQGANWNSGSKLDGTWWSFRIPVRPPVPALRNAARTTNPIDAFILAKLDEKGLRPAPEADRRTLARRAYFDLHGLPPTPEQIEAFVLDKSPDAYAKLIDRLLASPRYGERWGRYWLDLVRYADTSGFETDHFFVSAWRYRDWVIQSFNNDKPYDTFIQEQIAADEMWSTSTDLEGTLKLPKEKEENLNRRIGTSLFTLGSFPIEYTYYGDQYRAEWKAEAVDTMGAAFLGLTIACARCHDHKFDPITQRDYYRLTAMFAGSVEREIPLGSLFDVQTASRNFPLLAQAETLKQMSRGNRRRRDTEEESEPSAAQPREDILRKAGEAYLRAPDRMPTAIVLAHDDLVHDTHILAKGDFKNKGEKVEPGFPAALNPGPAIHEPKDVLFVPQRRKALAQWLTAPDQPLVARVMVNRIWQGHFGEGLVRTPNDFGRQGDAPTHPELFDWLAAEFVEHKYSIKYMHRQIMLSLTYRAASVAEPKSLGEDPENLYLSRMTRRRLDGDAIRDSILAAAGTLNLKMGGVGIIPPLSREETLAARMPNLWPANPNPAEHTRRSIYLQMKRSMTLPLLQIFDAPDTAQSCARRERSTVAPQALALMNSEFVSGQAAAFAARVRKQAGEEPDAVIDATWRIALGRTPTEAERKTARGYLDRGGVERLCLLAFNLNEFVYVD